jgi:lipopolysaccharide transport system permease protein
VKLAWSQADGVENARTAGGSPGCSSHVLIKAREGWDFWDWKELVSYRDLLYFLVRRDIKVRYAQSVLGIGWAVIQPLFSMIVFSIIFGRLAKVSSDGAPYALFSLAAMVPWTYFAGVLTDSGASVVTSQSLLTKVYFPRLILPMVPVLAKLLDFLIAFALIIPLLCWYRIVPTVNVVFLPLLMIILTSTAFGTGMWLTALSVQYRDIRYGMNFGIQLLLYTAPVVYPASIVPVKIQPFYALNPMVGVVEGFRAALLGTTAMPWTWIGLGAFISALLFVSGALYFRSTERFFADIA